MHFDGVKIHVAPTNAPFYNLCILSFTELLHVLSLFCHLQGEDIKISLKHTAMKWVTISVHVSARIYTLIVTYFVAVCIKKICHLPRDGKMIMPKHAGAM